jgi:hypothetical protein
MVGGGPMSTMTASTVSSVKSSVAITAVAVTETVNILAGKGKQ